MTVRQKNGFLIKKTPTLNALKNSNLLCSTSVLLAKSKMGRFKPCFSRSSSTVFTAFTNVSRSKYISKDALEKIAVKMLGNIWTQYDFTKVTEQNFLVVLYEASLVILKELQKNKLYIIFCSTIKDFIVFAVFARLQISTIQVFSVECISVK